MNEPFTGNIPSLSVSRAVEYLSAAYSALINADKPLTLFPSTMLWGPPGVGKSQAVRQLAQKLQDATGKRTVVTDVRLLLFSPIDLRGIPPANEDKTLAVWLKPAIFKMDESQDVINLLFLDEISAAPPSVQAAAYQITLDRTVGEHKLPDNCIVLAAGNRVTDKSVAYKMPKALANRLLHLNIRHDLAAWTEWALTHDIHPKLIGFLSFRQDLLMAFDGSGDDLAFATPRAWENVSNVLRHVSENIDDVFDLIAGIVGTGTATELRSWEELYRHLPAIEDVFAGKNPPLPPSSDALYALCAAMTEYAKNHTHQLRAIANSILYADRMPADFSAMLLRNYLYIGEDFRKQLMDLPEFNRWLSRKGKMLNGFV